VFGRAPRSRGQRCGFSISARSHTVLSRNDIGYPVPALTYDADLSTLFLLANWNGNSNGQGLLRLFTIDGPIGGEVLSLGPFVSVPDTWASNPFAASDSNVNFAPQSGSSEKISNGDATMRNVVYRNGSLWSVHSIYLPAASGARSAIEWWQITPGGSVEQRGRIDDPSGTFFYGYPSIAVNENDDALVGFTRFSPFEHASAAYALRAASDPANVMRGPLVFKAGEAPYFKTLGGPYNRWGDYSAAVPDPVNDTDLWTIQEYAESRSPNDRWGTWWARVVVPGTGPGTVEFAAAH
jgi:hypothetical protein